MDRLAVALLPVRHDVREELAGPGDAALEQPEGELREAVGDAAHEERAALRLHARAERTQVVRHVVRHRAPAAPAHAGGVRCGCDAQLDAAAPEGIVVVRRIEPEAIDALAAAASPAGQARVVRAARRLADRAVHEAVDHHRLEAEGADGVLELRDRLLGGVHRDVRGRCETIPVRRVDLGVEGVQRTAGDLPDLVVLDRRRRERAAAVEHREVDAEDRRGAGTSAAAGARSRGPGCSPPAATTRTGRVAQVARRSSHERLLHGRSTMSSKSMPPTSRKRFDHLRTADLAHEVLEEGQEDRCGLDDVAVGIDHRMAEFRAEAAGGGVAVPDPSERAGVHHAPPTTASSLRGDAQRGMRWLRVPGSRARDRVGVDAGGAASGAPARSSIGRAGVSGCAPAPRRADRRRRSDRCAPCRSCARATTRSGSADPRGSSRSAGTRGSPRPARRRRAARRHDRRARWSARARRRWRRRARPRRRSRRSTAGIRHRSGRRRPRTRWCAPRPAESASRCSG